MKRCVVLIMMAALLLSGCVIPIQRVSPDPTVAPAAASDRSESEAFDRPVSPEAAASSIPAPAGETAHPPAADPQIAVFWYAMADARVEELREELTTCVDELGFPCVEYDAENDASRQLEQVKTAVSDGQDLLLVNLVAVGSPEAGEEILRAAGSCPVIFFDRVPTTDDGRIVTVSDGTLASSVYVDREELGRVQGEMVGSWLSELFWDVDLNGDGHISYTVFVEDGDDLSSVEYSAACVQAANSVLAQDGLPALQYYADPLPDGADGFQWSPDSPGTSEGANTLMRANLSRCSEENGNMIELVIAESDEMALGALTALQESWYNLGDGVSTSILLFGIGATAGARAAIDLEQMSGSVDLNASGVVAAVSDLIVCITNGEELPASVPVLPTPLW